MKLLLYGHELLKQSEHPSVEKWDPRLTAVREAMKKVLEITGARGVSAPQLGWPLQIVLFRTSDGELVDLVNPYISRMYGAETEEIEHCLSFPPEGNGCKVARIQIIHVETYSVDDPGVMKEHKFKGTDARIVQHELDHLTGTFFFDRINGNERMTLLQQFQRWKKSRAVKEEEVDANTLRGKDSAGSRGGSRGKPYLVRGARG